MNKYLLVETGEGDDGTQVTTILGTIEEPTEEAIRNKIKNNKELQSIGYDKDLHLKKSTAWKSRRLFGVNECVASFILGDGVFSIRDKIRGNEGLQDLGYDKNLTLKEESTWHMPNLFGINKCVASYTINDDVFSRELVVLELK